MSHLNNAKPNPEDIKALVKEINLVDNLLKCRARSMACSQFVNPASQQSSWYGQNCYPRFPSTTHAFRNNSHHYYNRAKYTYQKGASQHSNGTVNPTSASTVLSNASKNCQNHRSVLRSFDKTSLVSSGSHSDHSYPRLPYVKNPADIVTNGARHVKTVVDNVQPCSMNLNCDINVSIDISAKESIDSSNLANASDSGNSAAKDNLETAFNVPVSSLQNEITSFDGIKRTEKPVSKLHVPDIGNTTTVVSSSKVMSEKIKYLNLLAKHKALLSTNHLKPSNGHQNRVMSSKYKVVNGTVHANTGEVSLKLCTDNNKAAIPIQNRQQVLLNKVEMMKLRHSKPLQPTSSAKEVVRTNFKIVNNKKTVSGSSLGLNHALKTSEAKRLLMQKIKALNFKPSDGVQNEESIKLLRPKSDTSGIKLQNTPAAASTDSGATRVSPECLKKKVMNANCFSSFDLTDISPEELVDLDHKSLLKLSAMVKPSSAKPKAFVKRTKYKISKGISSTENKEQKESHWHLAHRRKGNSHMLRESQHSLFKTNGSYLSSCRMKRNVKLSCKMSTRYNKTLGDKSYQKRTTKMQMSNGKSTIIAVHGTRFAMDPSGKSLKKLPDNQGGDKASIRHIDLGGKTYVRTASDTYTESPSGPRTYARKALNRSIQTVVAATAKKTQQRNTYCMFYNRFGKCNRQSECPYIHDPSKIAVCTRFLRGTCKVENCQFSHVRNPGKMALCLFFLQGTCNMKDCPYRHEILQPDAKLCQDFVKGYCAAGEECKDAHVLVCPQYIVGKCVNEKCPYPHPPQKERKEMDNSTKELELMEKCDLESRYFSVNSQLEVNPTSDSFLDRQSCSWVGEKAPALPTYIPLTFDDVVGLG